MDAKNSAVPSDCPIPAVPKIVTEHRAPPTLVRPKESGGLSTAQHIRPASVASVT